MKRILVWDLPVRLAHWLLAALVLGAFAIALFVSDESPAFTYHALAGLAAIFVVVLRLVWGVAGTRWARFDAWSFRPSELARYLRGVASGRATKSGAGHNPATSWFAVALLAGIIGLGVTGYLMGRGNDGVEEIHEALAWGVVGLVAVHVAGLLIHFARKRENVVASMITGRASGDAGDAIPSARAGSALVLLGLLAAFGALLVSGLDVASRRLTLPWTGTVLTIGESEAEDGGRALAPNGEAREAEDDEGD